MAAVDAQGFIKKRLQDIVIKVMIIRMIFFKQFPQELFCSGSPVIIPPHTEPAFFLQEIEEHDLAE